MEKSTHKVEVVPVTLEKHPSADSLSIVKLWGYTCVCRTEDWLGIDRAAWCPPDSLVDTSLPEFAFLAGDARYYEDSYTPKQVLRKPPPTYARIKAKKLRGIVSYGLLVPVPHQTEFGKDMADYFGVKHYDPPITQGNQKGGFVTGGEVERGPALYSPKYDVDSFQRYATKVFKPGEPVWVTEKIHGANGRWVFHDGRMYCGSRTEWKREYSQIPLPEKGDLINKLGNRLKFEQTDMLTDDVIEELNKKVDSIINGIKAKNTNPQKNLWWRALDTHPELRSWCEAHPDIIVYGEVYGAVQNLKYGVPDGQVRIGVFDLLHESKWVDAPAARLAAPELPWVPLLNKEFSYDFDKLVNLADGSSMVPGANHYREGIIVKPVEEREDLHIGRVQLKIVSPTYLEKS
jgi:RNA ligase (TIGR02306 family)